MTPTPRDVKSIFGRALEIDAAADRAAYLDEACGGDAGLRAEVEGLLATLGRAGAFLRRPAAAGAVGVTGSYAPVTGRIGAILSSWLAAPSRNSEWPRSPYRYDPARPPDPNGPP
jgi:hypothetical protein